MWNERLAQLATNYPTGVLNVADVEGFPALPAYAQGWRGKACLLLHRHNSQLEWLHQMVLKGELMDEGGEVILRVTDFVTANGQATTDEMPHAGHPIHLVQFLLLGRRKAREYERKRGAP
jgi:hypothetical protein